MIAPLANLTQSVHLLFNSSLPSFVAQVTPAGASEEVGLVDWFLRAGPVAKIIFGMLLLASVVSWTIMIGKYLQLRRAERQSEEFLRIFHRSARFSEVNDATRDLTEAPLVGLFRSGYAEIDTQIKSSRQMDDERSRYLLQSLTGLERSLRRALHVELANLSRGTQFLATTASASPFIGLFGTVWGIMIAFRDIANSGSTSIIAVAPGIAEALINTAAGLGAAIPALIGYNLFAQRLREVRSQMEDFVLEFLNLAERNFT